MSEKIQLKITADISEVEEDYQRGLTLVSRLNRATAEAENRIELLKIKQYIALSGLVQTARAVVGAIGGAVGQIGGALIDSAYTIYTTFQGLATAAMSNPLTAAFGVALITISITAAMLAVHNAITGQNTAMQQVSSAESILSGLEATFR